MVGIVCHSEGYYNQTTGNYSHAQNANNLVNGIASHGGGSGNTVNGNASFVHSIGSYILPDPGGDVGPSNVILGGQNNTITGNSITNTTILGGNNIVAKLSNTVYVPDLVINSTFVPSKMLKNTQKYSILLRFT